MSNPILNQIYYVVLLMHSSLAALKVTKPVGWLMKGCHPERSRRAMRSNTT